MSQAALTQGPSFFSFEGTVFGASGDALRIREQFEDFVSRFSRSATGSTRIAEPIQKIYDVYFECREPNWDGQGAEPVSLITALRARELLLALPSWLEVPEIFAEPTGAISFEWYRRPKHRFVLSIFENGSIEFAGLLGVGNEVYGTTRMDGDLPPIIRDHLTQLYSK